MVDLGSIRNASFTLTPTGYNPEEVDHFLGDLADGGAAQLDVASMRNASFSLTPTGYNPEEVDRFLGDLADTLESGEAVAQPVVPEPAEPHAERYAQEPDAADAPREPDPTPEAAETQEPDPTPAPPEPVESRREPAPIVEAEMLGESAGEQPGRTFEPVAYEPQAAPDTDSGDSHPPEPIELEAQMPQFEVVERTQADLPGLAEAASRAIDALQAFVAGELSAVREASRLEVDDIHAERQRLIGEASAAGREHLERTHDLAEHILEQARRDAEQMRERLEAEMREERERFEQALADREAQAQARVEEILNDAEQRRREADQLVASAAQAQAHMLASFEQARTSLIEAAERAQAGSTGSAAGFELVEAAADGGEVESEAPTESGTAQRDPTDAAA